MKARQLLNDGSWRKAAVHWSVAVRRSQISARLFNSLIIGGGCISRVYHSALRLFDGLPEKAAGSQSRSRLVREETPEASTVNRSRQIRRQSRLQPWGCKIKEGADFQRQKTAPEIDDVDGQRRRFEGFEHDLQLAVSNGVGDMI